MNCIHIPPANPNESPPPVIPVAKPQYASSSTQVRHDGRDWIRTGLCIHCDAAIYGATLIGGSIDAKTPLHHATPIYFRGRHNEAASNPTLT